MSLVAPFLRPPRRCLRLISSWQRAERAFFPLIYVPFLPGPSLRCIQFFLLSYLTRRIRDLSRFSFYSVCSQARSFSFLPPPRCFLFSFCPYLPQSQVLPRAPLPPPNWIYCSSPTEEQSYRIPPLSPSPLDSLFSPLSVHDLPSFLKELHDGLPTVTGHFLNL